MRASATATRTGTTHVVWVSIDTYSAAGAIQGTLLGARALLSPEDAHDVLDEVLRALPPEYRQLSGDEVRELLAARPRDAEPAWEQLSIF